MPLGSCAPACVPHFLGAEAACCFCWQPGWILGGRQGEGMAQEETRSLSQLSGQLSSNGPSWPQRSPGLWVCTDGRSIHRHRVRRGGGCVPFLGVTAGRVPPWVHSLTKLAPLPSRVLRGTAASSPSSHPRSLTPGRHTARINVLSAMFSSRGALASTQFTSSQFPHWCCGAGGLGYHWLPSSLN